MGTPTPEPPDTLPRPDENLIFGGAESVRTLDNATLIPVDGPAMSVAANSELWIVNLDDADVAPRTLRAEANGSFEGTITGQVGDRIRIVTRTDSRHSLPLDGRVGTSVSGLGISQLPFEGLDCLTIEPADLTALVDGKDTSKRFNVRSRCSEPVTLNAELRFGDAGFALDTPATVAANGRAAITVNITRHDDAREHADIVLLDVESGSQRGRYALGIWSVATSTLE
ncbi:MAG: hypothetical protein ABW352_08925 [Polyangiales bacterium]